MHWIREMEIRDARPEDAGAVARIYNQGIEDRLATLETERRTEEERREWLSQRSPRHPALVAVEDNEVIGWASLNPFNARPAYDCVADISVYIDRRRRGEGLGTALLRALEERARDLGYHKLVLAALAHNAAGMRLYERCGFRLVGVYKEQGMLDGTWVDVTVMEKILE